MSKPNEPSLFELLSRLPAQLSALLKAEYENAKREIVSRLKMLGVGALFIVFALFFVFFALGIFLVAAIAALNLVLPLWLSALIVAVALLVLAGLVLWVGFKRIQRGNPVPEETLGRVEKDFESLAQRGHEYYDDL